MNASDLTRVLKTYFLLFTQDKHFSTCYCLLDKLDYLFNSSKELKTEFINKSSKVSLLCDVVYKVLDRKAMEFYKHYQE